MSYYDAKVCTLGDRRGYPSHHHTAPSWHLRAPGTRGSGSHPCRPRLIRPVFRSACSHRSSWEMPRAFGSTKLLAVFGALGLALAAQGDIDESKNEQPVDAPHADLQPRSTPRRHHAQRFHHRNRHSAAVPALADVPFTSELYDRAFADFAMSNLGVSIAANASNQTKPEGK